MFERVSGIRLQGGYFEEPINLMLLSKGIEEDKNKNTNAIKLVPHQISFVYGKNGSGKTSIAEAFYYYKNGTNENTQMSLLNDDNNLLNSRSNIEILEKENIKTDQIFVFDDNYSKLRISFQEDEELKAIVMRQDQQNISKEIKQVESDLKKLNEETIPEDKNNLNVFDDEKQLTSPLHYHKLIKQNLTSNWAERHKQIQDITTPKIQTAFIDELVGMDSPEKDSISLRKELDSGISTIIKIREIQEVPDKIEIIYTLADNIDNRINNLLSKQISKPQLNEREQRIMQILTQTEYLESKFVQESQSFFQQTDKSFCPMCFRPISGDEKKEILNSINKVFDTKEAEGHRKEIESINLNPIQQGFEKFAFINNELVSELDSKITEFNNYILEVENKLSKKSNYIYTPIVDINVDLYSKYKKIKKLVELLEKDRQSYKDKIEHKNKLIDKLKTINQQLAFLENQNNINSYKICLEKQKQAQEKLETDISKIKDLETESSRLKAKEADINIAIEVINKFLFYIFSSKERIFIRESDGKYAVYSHGEHVELKHLSTGEKNAIALCYFFSDMLEDCKKEEFYQKNCLVILDDPVSSFDSANKVGVYSFLRYIIKRILTANENNRIIIFTHQFETMQNLSKISNDIRGTGAIKINPVYWELNNKKLITFNPRKFNNYSNLVQTVFAFANDTSVQKNNDTIGNTMRKLVEAFSSFSFKVGLEELFNSKEILNIIKEEDVRNYFENRMIRLLLHGESHMQNQLQGFPETESDEGFSVEDKERTARDVLVFLYLLNPLHLKKHLENKSDFKIVEGWKDQLYREIIPDDK